MSSSQPGLRLPVTGAFALPFTGYFIFLCMRVGVARFKHQVLMGNTAPPSQSSDDVSFAPNGWRTSNDSLYQATRAQQNFAEYVPLALILAVSIELNGGDPKMLRNGLAALLAARVFHGSLGITRRDSLGFGRPLGFYTTIGIMGWFGWWSTKLAWWGA